MTSGTSILRPFHVFYGPLHPAVTVRCLGRLRSTSIAWLGDGFTECFCTQRFAWSDRTGFRVCLRDSSGGDPSVCVIAETWNDYTGVSLGVVVSAVKDQGQSGSGWAFSGTQAVLSQLVLSFGGYRVDLSAQQRLRVHRGGLGFILGLEMPVEFVPTAPIEIPLLFFDSVVAASLICVSVLGQS